MYRCPKLSLLNLFIPDVNLETIFNGPNVYQSLTDLYLSCDKNSINFQAIPNVKVLVIDVGDNCDLNSLVVLERLETLTLCIDIR